MEDLLKQLQNNLARLIAVKQQLEQDNAAMRTTIQQQRNELITTHQQLAQLQEENKSLKTANAMLNRQNNEVANKKINHLIYLVDKTIQQLTTE